MRSELSIHYPHYPKVPLWRRGAALLVDMLIVGAVSSAVGLSPIAQAIVFLLGWLAMRVVLVSKNHGQSLGRWAFDIQIIDPQGRIPELKLLTKREAILGGLAFLAFLGLSNLRPSALWAPLLLIPLLVDCGVAFADQTSQQALHDRVAATLVVPSRRGYSLDLKIRRFLAQARNRVK
jgi:uncharacterized RDD family membrane protein YckC